MLLSHLSDVWNDKCKWGRRVDPNWVTLDMKLLLWQAARSRPAFATTDSRRNTCCDTAAWPKRRSIFASVRFRVFILLWHECFQAFTQDVRPIHSFNAKEKQRQWIKLFYWLVDSVYMQQGNKRKVSYKGKGTKNYSFFSMNAYVQSVLWSVVYFFLKLFLSNAFPHAVHTVMTVRKLQVHHFLTLYAFFLHVSKDLVLSCFTWMYRSGEKVRFYTELSEKQCVNEKHFQSGRHSLFLTEALTEAM